MPRKTNRDKVLAWETPVGSCISKVGCFPGLLRLTILSDSADVGCMDGRFETRYPADLEAWVTDLQNLGHSACGTVRDISNSGICLSTPLPLGPADIVRLDIADSVLFGFVTYANPEPSSSAERTWRTGIEVQRVLMGGSDLGQLLKKVLEEQMPQLQHEIQG